MTRTTADTSVVVAALSSWHPQHRSAREALRGVVGLPAHVLVETYSVLTRLPPPHRIAAPVVAQVLAALPYDVLTLDGAEVKGLVARLAAADVTGGSTYDGLVAATAAAHGCTLATLDARARRTYDVVGVVTVSPSS